MFLRNWGLTRVRPQLRSNGTPRTESDPLAPLPLPADAHDVPANRAGARTDSLAPGERRVRHRLDAHDLVTAEAAGEEAATVVEGDVVGRRAARHRLAVLADWHPREHRRHLRQRHSRGLIHHKK